LHLGICANGSQTSQLNGAAPVFEIELRHAERAALRVARVDHHDGIGRVEWQTSQEHRVDEGENRAGSAYAQGERGNCGEGETAISDETTRGKPESLQETAHRAHLTCYVGNAEEHTVTSK
jgi:hypothetical protein